MSRRRFPLFLALAVLTMMLLGHRAPAAASTVESISVDFSVESIDAARAMFACRVEVFDLGSGVSLGALLFRAVPGREMSGSLDRRAGEEIAVTVSVGEGGTSASYFLEYRRLGSLITRQRGRISLRPLARFDG